MILQRKLRKKTTVVFLEKHGLLFLSSWAEQKLILFNSIEYSHRYCFLTASWSQIPSQRNSAYMEVYVPQVSTEVLIVVVVSFENITSKSRIYYTKYLFTFLIKKSTFYHHYDLFLIYKIKFISKYKHIYNIFYQH